MDWKQVISELISSGLTQCEIAKAAGVAQSAISELYTGKTTEPRYSTGLRLMQLRRRKPKKSLHEKAEA